MITTNFLAEISTVHNDAKHKKLTTDKNKDYQIHLSNLDFQASLSLKNLCLDIRQITEWQPTSGSVSVITTKTHCIVAYHTCRTL